MESLYWLFPVSGVKTYFFIPPVVAFVVSFFTSMGGVSGAFLLLPFQVSFLNFTSPSVSATNFVYNIVAIPSGVYRYLKEGRMAWPLTWVVIVGTLPGVFIGYYLRVLYLPDPKAFKLFVGCVLLYIWDTPSLRNVESFSKGQEGDEGPGRKIQSTSQATQGRPNGSNGFRFAGRGRGQDHSFFLDPSRIRILGRTVFLSAPWPCLYWPSWSGIIGGTYGIGGGAIIAPFCVAVFRLPVYTVAGAALLGTFITSIAGVFFYSVMPAQPGLATSPDWFLGFLFGAGGFVGMYFGARAQKFVPQKFIKLMLGLIITFLALRYISQYFF